MRYPAARAWGSWLAGMATPLLCTLSIWPLREHLGTAGILLVYLLGVFLVATQFGRYPSILASLLSAAGFAYFFARPIFSFAISDAQNLIALAVMLLVAVVSSSLMEAVRQQTRIATQRERRATALYGLSRELARARQEDEIVRIAVRHIHAVFGARNALLLADARGCLVYPVDAPQPESLPGVSRESAQRSFDRDEPPITGMDSAGNERVAYFPLLGSELPLGVLAMETNDRRRALPGEQRTFLETFINQIVQALERARMSEHARNASVRVETESLRNSLLSAISHDLRTPLTTIVGASSTLVNKDGQLPAEERLELNRVIQEEALRMSDLTTKILDMARLVAGRMVLDRQWNALEEIVGGALNRLENSLSDRQVNIHLPENLPLVFVDAVLLQQVLVNLLENAVKYTPNGSAIDIRAELSPSAIALTVGDYGPGVPEGVENQLFDKFFRLQPESALGGVGLGLAICRSIIEAHGGEIHVENRPQGGAAFTLSLPLTCQPPGIEQEEEQEPVP